MDYSDFQKVKHELVKRYLGGWFPILGSCSGRIIYIDTHAGRGAYKAGQPGSPIVALNTLLSHKLFSTSLSSCEVVFHLIEISKANLAYLKGEIQKLGELPERVKVFTHLGDSFQILQEFVQELETHQQRFAPAFIFVDPYGFQIPGELLQRLMRHKRVELFGNLMWREVDMHTQQRDKPGSVKILSDLFIGRQWIDRINGSTQMERAYQATELLRENMKVKWCTPFFMLRGLKAIRYILLHFTNNDSGRKLMKDTMWMISPEAGYFVRKHRDQDQRLLSIYEEPDLRPLEEWVGNLLRGSSKRWAQLSERLLSEYWGDKHLNRTIKKLIKEGRIECTGKCAAAANPLLTWKGSLS